MTDKLIAEFPMDVGEVAVFQTVRYDVFDYVRASTVATFKVEQDAINYARMLAGESYDDCVAEFALDAAREALKPIRELHHPVEQFLWANQACWRDHHTTNDTETGEDVCLTCTAEDGGPVKVCAECFDNDGSTIDWPCPTARLVHSADELTGGEA